MFKRISILVLSLVALRAQAVFEVGQTVPDQCWKTIDDGEFCLVAAHHTVRVLLFGSGWCGACNEEFQELVPKSSEFNLKPVTFVSLSAAGWTRPAPPDQAFLKEWKDKFQIPFIVAASPKDAGTKFFEPPIYIPSVAVIDQTGKLAYKAVEPGVEPLFQEIRKLLP
jgi:peroxiredoxin